MAQNVNLSDIVINLSMPTLLFEQKNHAIYWLGVTDHTAFRCNAYLICSGEHHILIDPGSIAFTTQLCERVSQIMPPEDVSALVLCHQDPDVASSLPEWLKINPDICVITSPRAHVLLPHYGCANYRYHNIEKTPVFSCGETHALHFITAPHLHSPAAFTTWDATSHFLFSGDIWAALSIDWKLVCDDFPAHCTDMNMFHMDYMASNVAARGF
ncbi:MAG: MBL fold metallo-hydrolase, partial [Mariprofundaceae bacterium]|nr:MBL fold metallo-hydrolase [Mariprofundaceae bacterium]